jgi:hypothetical protein
LPRVTLWGGLLELNYEFSPLEVLDGRCEEIGEHYFDLQPHTFTVDSSKVEFVREVVAARTGFAKDFLVYGAMARPTMFDAPEIDLDYLLYNTIHRERRHERETLRVPAVVHAAWRAPDGRLGLLFVNLRKDGDQELELRLDLEPYGFVPGRPYAARLITGAGRTPLEPLRSQANFRLTLAPRRIVLLEVAAPDGA